MMNESLVFDAERRLGSSVAPAILEAIKTGKKIIEVTAYMKTQAKFIEDHSKED